MTAYNHSSIEEIGRIKDGNCCDFRYKVYDEHGKKKYIVWGNYCQFGIILHCCSIICQSFFHIYDGNCTDFSISNAIGQIKREQNDCVKVCCLFANCFKIDFPKNATAYDKLMIIGCTFKLDYNYFKK